MTPFGAKLRLLRAERGLSLKDLANALEVSSAYLSSLEHGRRGRPSWYLIQRTLAYFNLIWDDAEELVALARQSHPRVVIDTSGLEPNATAVANRLADRIATLPEEKLRQILDLLDK
jgi:transcriptional regulator with XRE-family HTH domain